MLPKTYGCLFALCILFFLSMLSLYVYVRQGKERLLFVDCEMKSVGQSEVIHDGIRGILKTTNKQVGEYNRLSVSLENSGGSLWSVPLAESTHILRFSVESAQDGFPVVITVYGHLTEEIDESTQLVVLPETTHRRQFNMFKRKGLSYWYEGADPNHLPIFSAALNENGEIQDISINAMVEMAMDCDEYTEFVFLDDDKKCIGIQTRQPHHITNSEDVNEYVGHDSSNSQKIFSSPMPMEIVGLHTQDCDNTLLAILFEGELLHKDTVLHRWNAPSSFPGISDITQKCLAIISLNKRGSIKEKTFLGPIQAISSDCGNVLTHLTINKELLVLVTYCYPLYITKNNGETERVLSPKNFFFPFNPSYGIVYFAKEDEPVRIFQLASGFLWGHGLLSLCNNQIYLRAYIGKKAVFFGNSEHYRCIEGPRFFTCLLSGGNSGTDYGEIQGHPLGGPVSRE